MLQTLQLSSQAQVFASAIRLWTNCFYHLLENLQCSSPASKIALEYLQEFIYYTYTFYTALLERDTFKDYRASWPKALDDLAQYRIIIAAMIPAMQLTSLNKWHLRTLCIHRSSSSLTPPSLCPGTQIAISSSSSGTAAAVALSQYDCVCSTWIACVQCGLRVSNVDCVCSMWVACVQCGLRVFNVDSSVQCGLHV